MIKLNIYLKERNAFQFPLKKEKIYVGRSSDNDILLPDPFCSRHHASLYLDEHGYVIQNNNSKNGTFLNGKRVLYKVGLKKGDEILIGTTRIVFEGKSLLNAGINGHRRLQDKYSK